MANFMKLMLVSLSLSMNNIAVINRLQLSVLLDLTSHTAHGIQL